MNDNNNQGTGRCKEATARVYLREGSGESQVRTSQGIKALRDYFYMQPSLWEYIFQVLKLFSKEKDYDLVIRVKGGGFHAQAKAIRLGVARAFLKKFPDHKTTLRNFGFLTRDPRQVERKKVGFKKARKKEQFSKR